MEPESSSPYPQVPATCPYPEPTPSSSHDPLQLLEDPSQYYPPIYILVSPVASFPQASPPTPCAHLYPAPIRATCPAHLIHLNFTTCTILGKEYRSFSSSLCSFLHSPHGNARIVKAKAVPLQAWMGPEGSRRLSLPGFKTVSTWKGGKVVSPMHRPPLPPGNIPGTHFC